MRGRAGGHLLHPIGQEIDFHPFISERHRRAIHLRRLGNPVEPVGPVNVLLRRVDVVLPEHRIDLGLRLGHESENRVDELLVLLPLRTVFVLVELVGLGVRPVQVHHRRHVLLDNLGVAIVKRTPALAGCPALDVGVELVHAHEVHEDVAVLGDPESDRHRLAQGRGERGIFHLAAAAFHSGRVVGEQETESLPAFGGGGNVADDGDLLGIQNPLGRQRIDQWPVDEFTAPCAVVVRLHLAFCWHMTGLHASGLCLGDDMPRTAAGLVSGAGKRDMVAMGILERHTVGVGLQDGVERINDRVALLDGKRHAGPVALLGGLLKNRLARRFLDHVPHHRLGLGKLADAVCQQAVAHHPPPASLHHPAAAEEEVLQDHAARDGGRDECADVPSRMGASRHPGKFAAVHHLKQVVHRRLVEILLGDLLQ